MKKTIEAILAVALAVGMNAHAALIYVDVSWAGATTGAPTTPYNTIGAAIASANAVAGPHTIYLAGGTYADIANGGLENYAGGGGVGGGYNLNERINIYGGYAGYDGGAGFDWTTRDPRSTIIDLNAAASRAFYQDDFRYPEVLDGVTFRNANHTAAGGAIYFNGGYGGGLTINDCLFENNVTTGNGGAVYSHPSEAAGSILNSDFVDNAGANGGALYYDPQYGRAKNIENCTFEGNSASARGGAVFINNWATSNFPQILGSTFIENMAALDGGALFNNNAYVISRSSIYLGNSAPRGAAIGGSTYWSGGYWLENCLIAGNTGGYAVQSEGARATQAGNLYSIDMLNCTVVDNPGGGIRARYTDGGTQATLRVRNSIVVNNGGYGIYRVDVDDPYEFGYNDVYGNTLGNYFNAVVDANSISADPLFVSAAMGDYRVKKNSPTILATLPNVPLLDYLGDARPGSDGKFTMGAFETPIPEPASLGLAALGLAVMALRRRRQQG